MRRLVLSLLYVILAIILFACNSGQKSEPQPAASSAPATSAGQPQQAAQTPQLQTRPPAEKPAAPVPPKIVTVPAGTELAVRLSQEVGSKVSQSGDTFRGTLMRPVEVNGEAAIPQGAEVVGHVAEAVPLGRFKGGAKLELALDSVIVHGTTYPVKASVSRAAQGKGKRTAEMVGGGAGLGAVVGAIAGKGKGAAIGALAGAGAGTAGTAFTGNKDIVLPAESQLTFKIQEPIQLK